jgi:hypothetical protein
MKKNEKTQDKFLLCYCIVHPYSKYRPQTSHVKSLNTLSAVISQSLYLILTGEVPQLHIELLSVVNIFSRQKRLLIVGE